MPKLNVKAKIIGENGNIYNLMSIVIRAMRSAGHEKLVPEFTNEVYSSKSYTEALAVISNWVEVE